MESRMLPKSQVSPARPMQTASGQPVVIVVGSSIIARFPQCMLKEQKPAPPITQPQ